MRKIIVAIVVACIAVPSVAQISKPVGNSSLDHFFDDANKCLSDFDVKARAKKLSVDTYKAALDGVCLQKLTELRELYMLSLERSPNQSYLIERYDDSVRDGKARMVADYAMR